MFLGAMVADLKCLSRTEQKGLEKEIDGALLRLTAKATGYGFIPLPKWQILRQHRTSLHADRINCLQLVAGCVAPLLAKFVADVKTLVEQRGRNGEILA
jgi:hypothetical protein